MKMNGDVYRGNKLPRISIYREHPGLMRPPKWMQKKNRAYSLPWRGLALAGGFALVIMGLLAITG